MIAILIPINSTLNPIFFSFSEAIAARKNRRLNKILERFDKRLLFI